MTSHIEVIPARDLPHVDVVRLQAGDVLVLHSETRLADAEYEHIVAGMKKQFPGHEVLVMEGGVKLSVVRKEGD